MRKLVFAIALGALVPLSFMGASCGDDTTAGSSNKGGGSVGGNAVGGGGNGGTAPTAKTNHDCTPPDGSPTNLALTLIGNYSAPTMVTHVWGDSSTIYIPSLLGEIKAVDASGSESTFLDLTSVVEQDGEGGLLGLAFHPDYADNGRLFVHYTELGDDPNTNPLDSVIEEYRRDSNNPAIADPTPVQRLLEIDQPYNNHDGGMIAFSPDEELLYIGWGDGGLGGDPLESGQDKNSLLGALVRLDVSTTPYSIPAGNITDGLPEIFHYGLRNPYRFSFDHCGNRLYIGDVGQDAWEEVDIADVGEGPINWGWNCMEGNNAYSGGNCSLNEELRAPAHEYAQTNAQCGGSITGGVVYRGSAIPWLRGAYIYGDFCTGQIWLMRYDGTTVVENTDITGDLNENGELGPQAIIGFGNDNDGNVYITSLNGQVYRLDAQ